MTQKIFDACYGIENTLYNLNKKELACRMLGLDTIANILESCANEINDHLEIIREETLTQNS